MRKPLTTLLLPLLLVGLALALPDDETIQEFKKYFKKYKDTPTRVEAVLALEGIDTPPVVDVLLPVLKDKESEVVDATVRVLGSFKKPEPVQSLLVALPEEKDEAVRLGLLRALARGGYPHDGSAVRECLADRSWSVRRRAVEALAATGDAAFAADLLPLVEDKEPAVRCASLDALTALKADGVREPAVRLLQDEVWQVRSSAIHALHVLRHKDSIRPLVERLRVEEGRLSEEVVAALENVTAKFYGDRLELWDRLLEQYGDSFEIPTDAQLAELRQKQAERKEAYTGRKPGASYHGIDTPSRSILFVIDVSGSMENEVVERDRFKDGDYPSFSRMDIVKTELARTIDGLEPYVNFNVLSFASDVKPWKKKLAPANVLNKSSAHDWVMALEPIGGASKQDLASVGLTGAANLSAGRTNTWAALAWALAIEEEGKKDEYLLDVDTVFFLSDGRPTHGRYVDVLDILREVKEANTVRKVVLHTIAIGEFQKTFMERLAEENGGVFVDLGR